jgi:hypothetical protein
MRIDASGNAMIGSSASNGFRLGVVTPSAASSVQSGLQVSDYVTTDYSITLNNGVAGVFAGNGQSLAFGNNNSTERMRIDSSGNVGVGTTSPASFAALAVVDKGGNGTLAAIDSGLTNALYIKNSGTSASITYNDAYPLTFGTNNAERMRITSSGNVGIGTTTTLGSLDVARSGSHSVVVRTTSTGDPSINLQADGQNNGIITYSRSGEALTFSNSDAERMRIDSSGNLGIGTSSPITKLTIDHAEINSLPNVNYLGQVIRRSNATSDAFGGGLGIVAYQNKGGFITAGGYGFDFSTYNGTTAMQRIRITSNGEFILCGAAQNVTAISTDPVHSIGDLSRNSLTSGALARLCIQERTANWISFLDSTGTHHGTIIDNGVGVTYGSNSDYRLKENIVTITDSFEMIKSLKPCKFNYIHNPEKTIIGFIAHEVQEVVPEAVTGKKDDIICIGNIIDAEGNEIQTNIEKPSEMEEGHTFIQTKEEEKYQQLDQAKLVPLLTAALQKAIQKIESLEQRIQTLEGNNND